MMLHRMQDRGEQVVVTLKMGARQLPAAPVAQRGGRDRRAGEAGRGRGAGRAHRFLGRGAGGDGRRRRLGGGVGGGAADARGSGSGRAGRCGWCSGPTRRTGSREARPIATRTRPSWTGTCMAMESDGGVFQPEGLRLRGLGLRRRAGAAGGRRCWQSISATAVEQVDESPEADITPLVEEGVPGIGLEVEGIALLLVSPQRRRHARQARSRRGGPLRRGDGGDGVRDRGSAGAAAAVERWSASHPEATRRRHEPLGMTPSLRSA